MNTKAAAGAAATPIFLSALTMLVPFMILGAAGGETAQPAGAVLCGGGGTAQTVDGVALTADQMANAQTITDVTATRQLPVFAVIVALTTAYTESTLHNYETQADHDSEGLFQQRISIYTAAVATDPVKATSAFLNRLVQVDGWPTNPVGVDAQAVQISKHPDRYTANQALGTSLASLLWPAAAAAAGTMAATGPTDPAICPGGGGAAGAIVGPHGNNVAGTTQIPAGFVISGTAKAYGVVRYALAQLGKPYVFAASGPNAFDCSGLTMASWATAGVALPHLASGQTAFGTPEPTNLTQALGGDLVMIPGADGTAALPGHVGMVAGYVDATDGRHLYIIQAPMTGLSVELTEATEWSGQIVDVRHLG